MKYTQNTMKQNTLTRLTKQFYLLIHLMMSLIASNWYESEYMWAKYIYSENSRYTKKLQAVK